MKRTLITLGLVTLLLSAFACERRDGGPGGGGTTDGGGAILVGIYGDLSGQTSSFGQSTRNGAQMAIDEINAAGGINGRKVAAHRRGRSGRSRSRLRRSSPSSSTRTRSSPSSARSLRPTSSPPRPCAGGEGADDHALLDQPEGHPGRRLHLPRLLHRRLPGRGRAPSSPPNTLKAKKAAILGDFNADYSKGLTQDFEQDVHRHGRHRSSRKQSYAQADADFKAPVDQHPLGRARRDLRPRLLQARSASSPSRRRSWASTAPLLGGDGWDSPKLFEIGGDALEGAYISNHYSTDDPSPAVQKFVADYKAKYGAVPDASRRSATTR